MSERAIPTKRHFDSLQCLTNALHKKSFYLGSPGSSSPDESACLGICAWPRWLYLPLFLPPLEKGSRLRLKPGKFAFSDETRKPPSLNCPYWRARKLHLRPLPCIWGSTPESRFQAVAARMPMTLMFAVAAKHKQNIVFTVTAKHKTRYFSIRTSQDPILLMNEAYQH